MGLCRLFGYSKQAYYKHQKCRERQQMERNIALDLVCRERYKLPRLGTRKLHYKLREQLPVGRDKLFGILRAEGLLIGKKRRYTKTTNSRHWMRKYPNKVRDLDIVRPEQVWVSDITYIATINGFQYLHLVTDAYSKQIMGYRLSGSMSAADTACALEMAINNRKYPGDALIHHSDRGLQYCSELYTKLLKANQIDISMTEQSDPYENAVAERINGILKDEFGLDDCFEDIGQLHKQIEQAILSYNKHRPHLSNHMLTPEQMHQQQQIPIKKYKKKAPVTLSLPMLA
jgi:transposase InsO family protein